jgi:hypothetical protein
MNRKPEQRAANPEEIRRLTEKWLNSGGREQLKEALDKARENNRTLRRDAQVDISTLNEPVTV